MDDKHYFASFALGWAVAETREKAIEKLVSAFRSDFKTVTANCQKDGIPGCYLWSCRVKAPLDTNYTIDFYAPKGVETDQGLHHHTTYISQKKIAYTYEKDMATHEKYNDD